MIVLELNKQGIDKINMPVVSVDIRFMGNIVWEDGLVVDKIAENCVDLWRVRMPGNDLLNDYLYALLDETEKERCDRFHRMEDRKRFIVSHAALRKILSGYIGRDAAEIEIVQRMPAKKPFLRNNETSRLQYNISHSGDWALIAVSKYEVGIDIELINSSVEYNDVAASSLDSDEIDFLNRSDQPAKTFCLLWTRKEALLKGSGKGLVDNLPAVPSLEGIHHIPGECIGSADSWHICSFNMEGQYMASLACNSEVKHIRYLNCVLDNEPAR